MSERLREQLAALLKATGLVELDYRDGDTHIHLVKDGAPPPTADAPARPIPRDNAIVAGMTGTFYRTPEPGAAPYVNLGDRITEGQTIGLIEAMKVLNLIEADRAGTITAIEAEDGTLIERGGVLFRIDSEDTP